MKEVCEQHQAISEGIASIVTSVAVIQSTLEDMKATKALNCEARIVSLEQDSASFRKLRVGPRVNYLEENSDNCKELRVGPRVETIENRMDKLLWGGVVLVGANLLGMLFVIFKGAVK